MADTPVEFTMTSGRTLTLELYPYGSDDIANGSGDSATEHTNRKGIYSAIVTEELSGNYTAHIKEGGAVVAVYHVSLADDTEVHRCQDEPLDATIGLSVNNSTFDPGSDTVTVGSNQDKTGYSLSSDYDAAKTAAQAGDEMDLVDAPNATAVAAIKSDLSTLDAAGVRAAIGLASANLDTQLGDIPTVAEFEARTILAASYSTLTTADIDARLAAIHLDHLLANAYDPTSKPGNASGLLNVLFESDSGVPRFTANALEQAPAGGGGGGGDATLANQTTILSQLASIKLSTDTIGNAAITVVSPVSVDGEWLTIVRGDDYKDAQGRAIVLSSTGWPDLTVASLVFTAKKGSSSITGTVTATSTGGTTQTIKIELAKENTSLLEISPRGAPYQWDLQATLSDGSIITLARGKMVVLEDIS